MKVSDKAIFQALYRAKSKGKLTQIRKGYYAILSPEYIKQGMVPATLFLDDLMKMLHRKYYMGLISAATLHGASHQQPMEYFVITQKPALRTIRTKKLKINFYVKKDWSDGSIMKVKTDAGHLNVSSPELTALDLFYYQNTLSLNNIVTILKELAEVMKPSVLQKIANEFPQVSSLQKLGYVLDVLLNKSKLADALHKVLKNKNLFPSSLSNSNKKSGVLNEKWKLIINTRLETDI